MSLRMYNAVVGFFLLVAASGFMGAVTAYFWNGLKWNGDNDDE